MNIILSSSLLLWPLHMIIYTVLLSCFLAFLFFICRHFKRQTGTIPKPREIPSEKGLPIIGVVGSFKESFLNYLFELGQKNRPIYQIRYGMRNIVVLNTYQYIKAALWENGDAFSGRWKAERYIYDTNNAGIFFIDGNVWVEQRAFVLKVLKDFGVGRSRSVEIVQDECVHMLEDLGQLKGQRFNLTRFLSLYSLNVISKFVMNKRFSLGDPELQNLQRFMSVMVTKNDPVMNFLLMFPFMETNVNVMKFILWITSRKSLVNDFHILIEKEIQEHLSKLDFGSDGDDLIDRFLIKQRLEKQKTGKLGSFTDWQLIRNVFELLMAGIDSTAITLTWSVMFMAMYPEVQKKVYGEILDTIGNERMPTMGDKTSLVYTQAVMDEILRLSTIAPLSDWHSALTDVNVKGYFIPTGTVIVPNLFASHLDPNVWENPFQFHPEHFLLSDPNGELKYRPREELIVFSMGKRQCLGESLARMEYFIFFVRILQRFQVFMIEENSFLDIFGGSDGLLRKPAVEEFIFNER